MKKILFIITIVYSCGLAAQEYTLEQLQEMSVQNNRTLKNARLDIEAAKEDRTKARTLFFPNVSASAVGFRGFEDIVQGEIPAGEAAMLISLVKKGFVGSVMAVQPLFQGGQIVNGNKLADLQEEVRRLQLQMTEKDTELQVAKYYWQIVSMQANIATLDSVKVQLDEVHRITKQYVDAGLITHNDLLRVELKEQELASNRLQLENGISIVKLLLAQLAGLGEGDYNIRHSVSFLSPTHPSSYLKDIEQATDSREEYVLSKKNEDAQALNVKMELGKLLHRCRWASMDSITPSTVTTTPTAWSSPPSPYPLATGGEVLTPSEKRKFSVCKLRTTVWKLARNYPSTSRQHGIICRKPTSRLTSPGHPSLPPEKPCACNASSTEPAPPL